MTDLYSVAIRDGAVKAWNFTGGMFSAVDVLRAAGLERASTYEPIKDQISITHYPMGDPEYLVLHPSEWLVLTFEAGTPIYHVMPWTTFRTFFRQWAEQEVAA